jgi:hypothetical protein
MGFPRLQTSITWWCVILPALLRFRCSLLLLWLMR